jgi:hypothetical protein
VDLPESKNHGSGGHYGERGEISRRIDNLEGEAGQANRLNAHAAPRMTASRQSVFQPARSRRFLKLVMGFARENRLRAVCLTIAIVHGSVAAAQPREIFAEHDIQHPVQAVLTHYYMMKRLVPLRG